MVPRLQPRARGAVGLALGLALVALVPPVAAEGPRVRESRQAPPARQRLVPGDGANAVAATPLSAALVDEIVRRAVTAVDDAGMAVAVVDRPGNVLAVFLAPAALPANAEIALGLARTGAFFSNDQAPLSSRTVRFISGIHFPPGIAFTPNGALYGIENTNRGCDLNANWLPGQALPRATALDGVSPGTGIVTGKLDAFDSDPAAVNPGGVPLFRDGQVVGGVGVAGTTAARAEFAAFTASVDPASGLGPVAAPPGVIFLDGIRLPFVAQVERPPASPPGPFAGAYLVPPAPGVNAPEGWLVGPDAGTQLSGAEVQAIVERGVAAAERVRAAIRLPPGSRTRMVLAVGDLDGTVLGLYRMPDATVFSVDVAVAKARNVVYFSAAPAPADLPGVPAGTAVTNRTISFGAQPLYPPGIRVPAGPFFDLYLADRAAPCTQGAQPPSANQNGIVFFPGSVPLYRNGILVGGFGVSGDGVEQDDLVSRLGALGFEAPDALRADRLVLRGARLPYLKFPRNPYD